MSTRLREMESAPLDMIVVGGGIYGATLAWAATRRGWRVALVEKADFGGGASANSLKILHGGLRYLQQLDLPRMRESIRARRRGMALQPHLARPAPFLLPTGGLGLRHPAVLWAALKMNDTISWDRNFEVPPGGRIPAGRILSACAVRDLGLDWQGLGTGAALWYDGMVANTERFTLHFLLSAAEGGAMVANYVAAVKIMTHAGEVVGLRVRHAMTGAEGELRAPLVVNTAGAWLDQVAVDHPMPAPPDRAWVRAFNVVITRRLFGEYGVGLEAVTEFKDEQAVVRRGKRNYFIGPWRAGSLLGTIYKPYAAAPDQAALDPAEIQDFLDDINRIYPPAQVTMAEVAFAHVGILPAAGPRGVRAVDPAKDTAIYDYEKIAGLKGYLAVKSVKYTTAIEVAERLVRQAARRINKPVTPDLPEQVYGGEHPMRGEDVGDYCREQGLLLAPDIRAGLSQQYGCRFDEVLAAGSRQGGWLERIAPGCPVIKAEILHAVHKEYACRLADVILRRTELGSAGYPGDLVLKTCAGLMAVALKWSPERQAEEVRAVQDHYRRLGVGHTLP